jgi:putative flippase GtrA
MSRTRKQLIRYGIVGLASNLAGYLTYIALTAFVFPPKLTMTLLYTFSATLSFLGNQRFTFNDKSSLKRSVPAFGLVHFVGWALNWSLLYMFSDRLGYSHQSVQAVSIFIVAAYLFVAMRFFVFYQPGNMRKESPSS